MRKMKASVQLAVEVDASTRDAAEYLVNRVIEATRKISVTRQYQEGNGTATVASGNLLRLRVLPVEGGKAA